MLERFGPVAEGLDHPEGVAWGPDGRLYAGGEAGQVYAIDPGGDVTEVGTTGGFLYGVTVDADANVYACDFGNASLQRIAPDGAVTTWSSGTEDRPMRVPNYAAFDDTGNLYVTDSGGWADDDGSLYRITPEGRTEVWSEDVPAFPNGCCLSADGDALLVIESHARRVVRVPIHDDGSAGAPTAVVDLTGSQPDGIALAADGTMLIGCYRPDRIWRVDPDGRAEVLAEDPDGVVLNQPANIAFWGPARDRIVVSSLGGWNLMSADIGLVGLPLRYPRL
ncbi:MAG: SMP-30/gluconolactonase/LRE family protein [Planctomycetaceae bacterium]